MRETFWLILFAVTLAFDIYLERQFILIYYTIWTFILETMYFVAKVLQKPRWYNAIFPIVFAPSLVVCIGFWIVIAPTWSGPKPQNVFFIVVTEGFNAVALLRQVRKVSMADIWKPCVYTLLYNMFLVLYVGAGGRSISGRLPYWYAQYDNPIGWVFFMISVLAVAITHTVAATYIWPPPPRPIQYIV